MSDQQPTRGAPPKRGAHAASTHLHIRLDVERKNHYTRYAKKRRTGDKTLAGLVIETLDATTGFVRNENDQVSNSHPDKTL